MKKRKGFTLIELMVVILIVGILAAVAIPILRGRIDAAKWSEGRAMMGSIGTAIRAYHGEKGPTAAPPTGLYIGEPCNVGFITTDLTGTYFDNTNFSFTVSDMDPLTFVITATPVRTPLRPSTMTLNQAGVWTEVP